MTTIILVRHGQTEWNRVERFRGVIDVPLNEAGQAQARAVGARLSRLPITAVYSSPLSRARETALAIADPLGLPVRPLDGLRDIDYGEWGGLSPAQVHERYPDLVAAWYAAPHTICPPGGEGLDDVLKRAMGAVLQVVSEHPNETVILLGHVSLNRVVCCAMLGLDNSHFWRIRQQNGCVNIFEHHDGQFDVVTLNDTCHLA